MILTIALSILVAGILGGILAIVVLRIHRGKMLKESLEYSLFLIKHPRTAKEETDFKTEINHFEEFLGNLASLKKPIALEVAVPHIGEEISFYISVPNDFRDVALRQIQGIWAGASVEEVKEDFNIFNSQGVASAAYLTQRENFSLPIRTYLEIGADTVASVVGGFTKINEIGEGAALQLILRPASEGSKKIIKSFLESFKKGFSRKQVFAGGFSSAVKSATESVKNEDKDKEKEPKITDEEAVKILQAKISKPLFEVNARILTSASVQAISDSMLDGIAAGFDQLSSAGGNSFKIVKPKSQNSLIYKFVFRNFDEGQKMILNSEEISSFYHFPISSTQTPRINWLKSKEAPPPADLPAEGLLIGESVFRGEKKPIRITDEDRRRHIYVIGQTGTGKTVFLRNLITQDIKNGKGVCIIDPHGEFSEITLANVPPERMDDVIYFNPADLSRPMGLNMLEYDFNKPEQKTFIVNEMLNIFTQIFPDSGDSMGPMFQQYMRNALLLLMEDAPNEPATLVEVPRIFTDAEFRKRKLARIKNPVVIDFWEKEAVKAGGEASLANMVPYITSKFGQFISNDYLRPIIGQAKSSFNFREIMDSGKILLLNLSKGRIGDLNANLLGMIITGKLLMAALSRVDIADEKARKDFNLYIDEFHNFTTDSISTILSEARKYHLSLTIAHQDIAQLKEKIRDSIFGNVGTQIVFRVGVQDAEFLVKQFEPIFDINDLINIPNLNFYTKMLINGQPVRPFNVKEGFPPAGEKSQIDKLRELSREKYGMSREQVETEIYKRLRE